MRRGRERCKQSVALASLILLAACATTEGGRTVLPVLDPGDTDRSAGYEPPPVLRASQLLLESLLRGPHHEVQEDVVTDGFIHIYQLKSEFGDFEARSDEALRLRVREIEALARLRDMSKTKEFAKALARGLKSPFVATWNLIRHPVDSIVGIPLQAWNVVKKTAELTKRERGELEDSGFREFIGFETSKRELAYRLGVDPYSSNPVLQRELNRHAWVAFAGELPFALVPFQGEQDASLSSEAPIANERLAGLLLHYSPEDLRRLNRIELAVMGISEELSDRFLRHPWYSPRHATILIESLTALELTDDRQAFFEVATRAESEFDALFHQRSAELLRAYHDNHDSLARIVRVGNSAAGYTPEGKLVLPVILDHAVWTKPTAEFCTGFADRVPTELEVKQTQLLLSGTLSEKARREIQRLGFEVTEHAFEKLKPEAIETSRGEP